MSIFRSLFIVLLLNFTSKKCNTLYLFFKIFYFFDIKIILLLQTSWLWAVKKILFTDLLHFWHRSERKPLLQTIWYLRLHLIIFKRILISLINNFRYSIININFKTSKLQIRKMKYIWICWLNLKLNMKICN